MTGERDDLDRTIAKVISISTYLSAQFGAAALRCIRSPEGSDEMREGRIDMRYYSDGGTAFHRMMQKAWE